MTAAGFTPASLLFVPGSRPERFAKALDAGADMVCLDLEDAVAPADKARARRDVLDHVAGSGARDRLCVRINRLGSADGVQDAAALVLAGARPAFVMMPKVETARDAELFAAAFERPPILIALIESARGIEAAFDIARAPAVGLLMFGSFDYAAETGGAQDWATLLPVRSRLVAAGAAAGKPLIDSPYADLADVDGAAAENYLSRRIGCAGRAAIHPRMIPGIAAAFTPDADEIAEARAIVAAFDAAGGGAARVGGRLIELPVVLRMRRLLDRANARG